MTLTFSPRKKRFRNPFKPTDFYIGTYFLFKFTNQRLLVGFAEFNMAARKSIEIFVSRFLQKNFASLNGNSRNAIRKNEAFFSEKDIGQNSTSNIYLTHLFNPFKLKTTYV